MSPPLPCRRDSWRLSPVLARRYHRLVREADLMQKRAAEALEAAKRHNQVYEQKMKEAQLHQSRHAELWHEAQM